MRPSPSVSSPSAPIHLPPGGEGERVPLKISALLPLHGGGGRGEAADGGGKPHPSPAGCANAVRLGLREVKGFKEDDARRLMEARKAGAHTAQGLAQAARLSPRALELLAEADALRSLEMDRREGLWAVKGAAPETRVAEEAPLLALMGAAPEPVVPLPP